MKITINYNISKPDTDLLCIYEEISVDDFHGTGEEITILLKTTRQIKEICREYEKIIYNKYQYISSPKYIKLVK